MKKLLIVLMVVAMASFLFVGCLPTTNIAPVITSTPSLTGTIGTAYTYTVTATDADGDTLTYAVVGPTGMVISTAGVVSGWTPTVAGTYAVVVTVSDGKDPVTQSFIITVSAVEPEPEFQLVAIKVDPGIMKLVVGDIGTIVKVTAFYEFRGHAVEIDLGDCTFVSDDKTIATVSDAGLVTAIKAGTADILVGYGGKTDTVEVTVKAATELKSMEIKAYIPTFTVSEPPVDFPNNPPPVKGKNFTVKIEANSDVGKWVISRLSEPIGYPQPCDICYLEYYDDVAKDWVWLGDVPTTSDIIFGDSEYRLCDEVMSFRGTFYVKGTYKLLVEVWTVEGVPLCYEVISFVVEK